MATKRREPSRPLPGTQSSSAGVAISMHGVTAHYLESELRFMRRLWKRSKSEALFVHLAKAEFNGRLR